MFVLQLTSFSLRFEWLLQKSISRIQNANRAERRLQPPCIQAGIERGNFWMSGGGLDAQRRNVLVAAQIVGRTHAICTITVPLLEELFLTGCCSSIGLTRAWKGFGSTRAHQPAFSCRDLGEQI